MSWVGAVQEGEVVLSGMARGGLSELPRRSYFTAALSPLIAAEVRIAEEQQCLPSPIKLMTYSTRPSTRHVA